MGPFARQPLGGWYGLKKGLRGRFANYVPPPLMEALGLAELEHNVRNNRMWALQSIRGLGRISLPRTDGR